MSDIVLPESEETQEETVVVNYDATEADEEKFFLMYAMNMQPSEVDALDENRRKWIIGRFMLQKQQERAQMESMALAQKLQQSGGIIQ